MFGISWSDYIKTELVCGSVELWKNTAANGVFRFKPETVTVAEVTAGGLQATIQYISENLNYWLDLGWAYVDAIVPKSTSRKAIGPPDSSP